MNIRGLFSGRLPNVNICYNRTLCFSLAVIFLRIRCTTVNSWLVTSLMPVLNHSLIIVYVFVLVIT